MTKKIILAAASLAVIMGYIGCSTIQNTLTNIQRLKFKLNNVSGLQLAGVNFSNKNTITDFSISEGLQLTRAFANKSFPTEFILNVAAVNPNDGSGGSRQSTATLTGLDWRLLIDGRETVAGDISEPVTVPGTGQEAIIPLRVRMDLYQFFAEQGYENILRLALALGGVQGNAARLSLDARPTVSTPFGPISYPGRITIVDKEFR